jgi:hypothetical protein
VADEALSEGTRVFLGRGDIERPLSGVTTGTAVVVDDSVVGIDGEGTLTVSVRLVDLALNETLLIIGTVDIDATAPRLLSHDVTPAALRAGTAVAVAVVANEEVDVAMGINDDPVSGEDASQELATDGLSDGPHSVVIRLTDPVGNTSTVTIENAFVVDSQGPAPLATATSATSARPGDLLAIDVAWNEPSSSARLRLGDPGGVALAEATDDLDTRTSFVVVVDDSFADGEVALWVTDARDEVGNVAAPFVAGTVTIDATPPAITGIAVNRELYSAVAPFNGLVVDVDVDDETGVDVGRATAFADGLPLTCGGRTGGLRCSATIAQASFTRDRPVVTVAVPDAAGNVAVAAIQIAIDTRPPTFLDGAGAFGGAPGLDARGPVFFAGLDVVVVAPTDELVSLSGHVEHGAGTSTLAVENDGSLRLAGLAGQALDDVSAVVAVVEAVDVVGNTTRSSFVLPVVAAPPETCPGDPADEATRCVDIDLDGHVGRSLICPEGPDCDDTTPLIHPDAVEVPFDGVRNDCTAGEELPPSPLVFVDAGATPGAGDGTRGAPLSPADLGVPLINVVLVFTAGDYSDLTSLVVTRDVFGGFDADFEQVVGTSSFATLMVNPVDEDPVVISHIDAIQFFVSGAPAAVVLQHVDLEHASLGALDRVVVHRSSGGEADFANVGALEIYDSIFLENSRVREVGTMRLMRSLAPFNEVSCARTQEAPLDVFVAHSALSQAQNLRVRNCVRVRVHNVTGTVDAHMGPTAASTAAVFELVGSRVGGQFVIQSALAPAAVSFVDNDGFAFESGIAVNGQPVRGADVNDCTFDGCVRAAGNEFRLPALNGVELADPIDARRFAMTDPAKKGFLPSSPVDRLGRCRGALWHIGADQTP